MQALLYRAHGSADVLQLEELPNPTPGPGDLLLHVAATAVNRLDIVQRNGWFTLPGFSLPHVAGMDIAGTVLSVGPDVTDRVAGERVVVNPSLHGVGAGSSFAGFGDRYGALGVLGGTHPGGYATHCLVPADHAYAIPDNLSFPQAAAFPTAWMTAEHALFQRGLLLPGEILLVHGGSSSLSAAAIQLAKAHGCRVLATASDKAKAQRAQDLGADATWVSGEGSIADWVMEVTQGQGTNMVFDHVGAAHWTASLAALAPRGRMVCVGNTTGDQVPIPSLGSLYQRGISIIGSDAFDSERFSEVWERFCVGISDKTLSANVGDQMPLAEGGIAHRRMQDDDALGKLILLP